MSCTHNDVLFKNYVNDKHILLFSLLSQINDLNIFKTTSRRKVFNNIIITLP